MLCELKMNIHNPHFLWITPVDKDVENVENYELSTGISVFSKFHIPCGNPCITLCIKSAAAGKTACYVTAANSPSGAEILGRSLQNVKIQCQTLSHSVSPPEFFVKKPQSFSTGILFPQPGNTTTTQHVGMSARPTNSDLLRSNVTGRRRAVAIITAVGAY